VLAPNLAGALFAAGLERPTASMIMAIGSLVAAGVLTLLVVKSDAATEAESGETARPEAPAGAIAHGR
jgi:hypothetical protein